MERLPAGLPLSRGCRRGPFSAPCCSSFIWTTYLIVFRLFADDCLLYRTIEGIPDQLALQSDLTKLQQWADLWGMQFNPGKCIILTISHGTPKYQKFYTLCGQILQHTSEAKYLGVTLSSDLQWSKHIQDITSKCSSTLGLLRRNLSGCPIKLREQAYIALIRSRLEYCSAVWDPHLKKDINSVEAVQRASQSRITDIRPVLLLCSVI